VVIQSVPVGRKGQGGSAPVGKGEGVGGMAGRQGPRRSIAAPPIREREAVRRGIVVGRARAVPLLVPVNLNDEYLH